MARDRLARRGRGRALPAAGETLEVRRLLANIVGNSLADPAGFNPNITIAHLGSTVTLRDAWNAADNTPGVDVITFAPSLASQTILLNHIDDLDAALAQTNTLGFQDTTIQELTTGGESVDQPQTTGQPQSRDGREP